MSYLPVASPSEIGLNPVRLERAFELLDLWTGGPDPPVPGAAILVGRSGKMISPRRFGRQSPGPNSSAIRTDSVFLLASITKPVTYLAAMMLVERGLLNLSDPVTRYIPEFAAHHKDATLVQHLFTHTSGLPDMLPENVELRRQHAPLEEFTRRTIFDVVPLFTPGTDFNYQSMGTLIAAEIVQRISRTTIHDFVKKEIFEPLELSSTGLGSRGLDRDRIVRVLTPDYLEPAFDWNSKYWHELGAPWGGMFSSPEDFAVICQCMLNGGSYGNVQLWSPAAIQFMTTNRLDDYPKLPEFIRRTTPWGLGWRMNHPGTPDSLCDILGRHVYGHTGSTGTLVWMDPVLQGFCILFTSEERVRAPWRLVHLSNCVAAAFE